MLRVVFIASLGIMKNDEEKDIEKYEQEFRSVSLMNEKSAKNYFENLCFSKTLNYSFCIYQNHHRETIQQIEGKQN